MAFLNHGNLCFISDSPVLDQVARDLARAVSDPILLEAPIDVIVGVHRFRSLPLRRNRRVLGIQTEHLLGPDAQGARRGKSVRKRKLLRYIRQCDLVLDFAPYNKAQYGILPRILRRKLLFGPYAFPEHEIAYQTASGSDLLFVGALNGHRKATLAGLADLPIKARSGLYGPELDQAMSEAAAIVNLHHWQGVYSEVPRLLSAYLEGKAIVSEELAAPFVAGRHYVLPEQAQGCDYRSVFEAFRDEIAGVFTFETALRRVIA